MNYTFKPEDITVCTWTSANTGGFNLNVPSGVKVTHIPTGQQFTCEEHRSQHRNRVVCLDMLEEYLRSLPPQQTTQDSHFAKLMKTAVDIDGSKCIMIPEEVESEGDFIKWVDGLD